MDYSKIQLVCIDVDGTLTNGIYQISEDGKITKSFYTRDFYGIQQLLENGLKVFIVTQSHDNIIHRQIDRICSHSEIWKEHFLDCCLNIITKTNDKKKSIEHYMGNNTTWDNVAYIGDAENDLECMKVANFTGCPADAIPEVIEESNNTSMFSGGRGAVYDICTCLLKKIKKAKEEN